MFAAHCNGGSKDIITALYNSSADLSAKSNYGDTAMMLAADNGNVELVYWIGFLSEDASNLANEQDKNGYTALMFAAERGHEEVVKRLIGVPYVAHTYLKDYYGKTAARIALDASHKNIAELIRHSHDCTII